MKQYAMQKIAHNLALLSAAIWLGGMCAIGYLAAPVLFQTLTDRQLAGMLAGKLFAAMAYTGMVCALYLLVYHCASFGRQVFRKKLFWMIVVMLLLTVAGQFGIQPILADLKVQALPAEVMQSAFAGAFKTWHGVASVIYLAQSLMGIVLVLNISKH